MGALRCITQPMPVSGCYLCETVLLAHDYRRALHKHDSSGKWYNRDGAYVVSGSGGSRLYRP
jgi:hypothetical protein